MSKVHDILARLAGRSATLRAAIGGHDILSTLEGDHREIRMLMDALIDEAAAGDALEERRYLFHKIRAALVSHAKAEEHELYRVLGSFSLMRAQLSESAHDHAEIETLVEHLERLPLDDAMWLPTFTTLMTQVERHVSIEEGPIFSEARQLLTHEQLVDMDAHFRRVKQRYHDLLEGRASREQPVPVE